MSKLLRRVYLTWKHLSRWIEVILQVTRLTFPQQTGLCVRSNGTEERDESHDDLTRHSGKSAVAIKKVLRRVYLTWKHPRRWIEVIFQVT
jgi:hypothetical protein